LRFQYHFLACSILSLVYFQFSKSLLGVLLIFASGFAIDSDHLLSYQLVKGDLLKGNPFRKTLNFYAGHVRRKNFLLFHFLELGIIVALLLSRTSFFLPFLLGWGVHMLLDSIYFIHMTAKLRPDDEPVLTYFSRYSLLCRIFVAKKVLVD
jgi:hypothetical protein